MKNEIVLPKWIKSEIELRAKRRDALNLTAVKREKPEILEYLFRPKKFIGWHNALLACGLDPMAIPIELEDTVECQICGAHLAFLPNHLMKLHETTAEEYRIEFPGAPVISESMNASRTKLPRRAVGKSLPHSEPIWSLEYALDRLHLYHQRGDEIHARAMGRLDPRLRMYLYHGFPSYDEAIRAIGLDPEQIHVISHKSWDREKVIRSLQERKLEGKSFGIVAMREEYGGLIFAATRIFGSLEKAMKAAGLDPKKELLRKPRIPETFFAELEEGVRTLAKGPRDEQKIASFWLKYGPFIQNRYGNRRELAKLLKVDYADISLPRRIGVKKDEP